MGLRRETVKKVVLDGKPFSIRFIDNPTIDDVLSTEMQVQAYFIASGTSDPTRQVDYSVRDYLIRLGVER